MPKSFYVYAYIRAHFSVTADAGTPYYIGKGYGNRAYDFHSSNIPVPKNKEYIVILENNLTEVGSFALERRLICWWGRKDIGTGVLINKTDGGDGATGYKMSVAQRSAVSERLKGKLKSAETKAKMSKSKKGLPSNNKGKQMSDTARQNVAAAARQRDINHPEYRINMSQKLKEYYVLNPKGKHNQEKISCPHCKLIGGNNAMKRWHFDNCKKKD